ncbi:hypothetical protein NCLIV_013640 [Neospora caninum Liverpool]|uniref:Myb family DNA-binding domain-containing protein n=1 Tax=Neospora caninum (strain Liverpool) TaxID=572307 RepID=F0VD56_NEOCL|nr:hypothetical protein NCLIV_013640 [Neospora caninum Liverpool]CBZ51571.1 hypothetical protein NCLIV_013640 [Neospora caninum Liverpool]CEL65521.1 TPA: Myb family DNA-binding domain-containing protein [Neospora caninum Liverpool]|eukprot:XP_003881604.1 hypothetical protein NCLIV_013640 [Neospora caninum Liverpool]
MSLVRDLLGFTPQTAQGVLQLNERLLLHEAAVPAPPASSLPEVGAAASTSGKERSMNTAVLFAAKSPLGSAGTEKLAKNGGLARDFRAAVIGGTTALPSLPAVMHRPRAKRGQERRPVSKWRMCAFSNGARQDGLCLAHWRKVTEQQARQLQQQVSALHAKHGASQASESPAKEEAVKSEAGSAAGAEGEQEHDAQNQTRRLSFQDKLLAFLLTPEKEYPFARFNVKTVQPPLTADLYEKYIQPLDNSWSAEETFQLWHLVHECDLHWPVIFDAFPASFGRSVEELKQRYYAVAKSFVAECQRRLLLERQQRIGAEELQAEQALQSQIRAAEGKFKKIGKAREEQRKLQRRFDLPPDAAPPVSATDFLELKEPTCVTLSVLLEETKNSRVSEKGNALIDSYLSSLGVAPPVCFTYNIAESYWGLRTEVSTMLHLRQRVEKLKEELNYWTTVTANLPPLPVAGAALLTSPDARHGAAHAPGGKPVGSLQAQFYPRQSAQAADGRERNGPEGSPQPPSRDAAFPPQGASRSPSVASGQNPDSARTRPNASLPAASSVSASSPSPHSASPSPPPRPQPHVASGASHPAALPPTAAPTHPGLGQSHDPAAGAAAMHAASHYPVNAPGSAVSAGAFAHAQNAHSRGLVPSPQLHRPGGSAPGAAGESALAYGGVAAGMHADRDERPSPLAGVSAGLAQGFQSFPSHFQSAGFQAPQFAPAQPRAAFPQMLAHGEGAHQSPDAGLGLPSVSWGVAHSEGTGMAPVSAGQMAQSPAMGEGMQSPYGSQLGAAGVNRGNMRPGQAGPPQQSKPPRSRSRSSSASAGSPYPSAMALSPSGPSGVPFGQSASPSQALGSFADPKDAAHARPRAESGNRAAKKPRSASRKAQAVPAALSGYASLPAQRAIQGPAQGGAGAEGLRGGMLAPAGPEPNATHHQPGTMHALDMSGMDHGLPMSGAGGLPGAM